MEQRQHRHRRIRQLVVFVGIPLLALAGIALLVFMNRGSAGPGESFAIQGRQHIPVGATHDAYNSSPPTSGWHYADQVAPWGVSASPIANEIQVHNLEHGGIVIQYKDTGDAVLIGQLTALARSYPTKIVLAPYTGMPARIALTAWGRRQTFEQYDEAAIRAFITAYINKGPEDVP